jgi:hypothetical protein
VDPTNVVIKQDVMDTIEESRKRNYPFVAPGKTLYCYYSNILKPLSNSENYMAIE